MINKLKEAFEKSCNDYINYFCKKQDIEFEFWVGDEVGGIACFCGAQYFLNITDIVFDINTKQPKYTILDWQNYNTDYRLKNDSDRYINYQSYIKGARFESIPDNNDLD